MEVREDGLVLKTKRGEVVEHCPYDGIVNMTFSPKTKIICIWRRSEGITLLKKYHTKKVKRYIFSINITFSIGFETLKMILMTLQTRL